MLMEHGSAGPFSMGVHISLDTFYYTSIV